MRLGSRLAAVREWLATVVAAWRYLSSFEPSLVDPRRLPLELAARRSEKRQLQLGVDSVARIIYLVGKVMLPRPRQLCLARAGCLATLWSDHWGQPTVNIGVDPKAPEGVAGHVWISIGERVPWRADELARERFGLLMGEDDGIRFWIVAPPGGHLE